MSEPELIMDFTQLLTSLAKLLQTQREHTEQLHAELDQATARTQAANDVLRQLVQIVDPGLWQDGTANTAELVRRVQALRGGVSYQDHPADPADYLPPDKQTPPRKGVRHGDDTESTETGTDQS